MEFKYRPFDVSVKVNTITANRMGYTSNATPTSIDAPTSAEMHKRLFRAYWQASMGEVTTLQLSPRDAREL